MTSEGRGREYASALVDLWCAQQADRKLLGEVRDAHEMVDPTPAGLADDCLAALAGEDGKR